MIDGSTTAVTRSRPGSLSRLPELAIPLAPGCVESVELGFRRVRCLPPLFQCALRTLNWANAEAGKGTWSFQVMFIGRSP